MIVDEYQNTRVPNIHSLGNCCGKWELTPVAIAARFRSLILRHLSRFRKIHPIIAHICRSSSPVSQSDTEFDLLSPAKISRIGSEPLFLTAEGVLRPGNTLSLSSKLSTPNFTNDPGILGKLVYLFLHSYFQEMAGMHDQPVTQYLPPELLWLVAVKFSPTSWRSLAFQISRT